MQKPITIFCAFTRGWAVQTWLDNLAAVDHDPKMVNFTAIIDIDDEYIAKQLKAFNEKQGGYRSFHVKMNEDWQPNEVRLAVRRMRIADVKNQSKDLIAMTDGEIIMGFEDDTVFDRLPNFDRLINPILEDDRVGFVEGIQMGRWGANMVGVWEADDFEFPQEVKTLLPPDGKFEGYQEVTGGGWYGYATQRELYLNCDYFTSSGQPWGPDVNFGFWLKQRGYKVLADWGTVFGHSDHGNIGYPDNPPDHKKLIQVIYNRDKLTGKWERRDYEQHTDRY